MGTAPGSGRHGEAPLSAGVDGAVARVHISSHPPRATRLAGRDMVSCPVLRWMSVALAVGCHTAGAAPAVPYGAAGPPALGSLCGDWQPRNATEGNPPMLTNARGSAACASTASGYNDSMLGLSSFDQFPFVGFVRAGEPVLDPHGDLWRATVLDRSQWGPTHAARRGGVALVGGAGLQIESTVRLAHEDSAFFTDVTIRNNGSAPLRTQLATRFRAAVRKVASLPWVVPIPSDDDSYTYNVERLGGPPCEGQRNCRNGNGTEYLHVLDTSSAARLCAPQESSNLSRARFSGLRELVYRMLADFLRL